LGLPGNQGTCGAAGPPEAEWQRFGNDHLPSRSLILFAASLFKSGTTSW
jgi:hypothetical protein